MNGITRTVCLCLALVASATAASVAAQVPAPKKPDWTALTFLLGSWVADPNPNEPGVTGSSDFRFELDGNILVRKNKADYPSQNGKPAQHHSDLMIIFANDSGVLNATYWDNEPHMIQYEITTRDNGELVFTTSAIGKGPRFRLVYKSLSKDSVSGRFDIAVGGGEFKPYKQWTMRRLPEGGAL